MTKKYEELTIHQKLVSVIHDMVEKEIHLTEALEEFEKIYIETAASKYNSNITKMARALGVHRNTLHNRFKTLKIKRKK
ncbi:MAG: helix-turn-helix domain-containing protein [Candidatus Saccharicenans sp.]|nr:helix-turn-helix domain-containing protein [Candidatus Saccharicenans sp.]